MFELMIYLGLYMLPKVIIILSVLALRTTKVVPTQVVEVEYHVLYEWPIWTLNYSPTTPPKYR